MKKTIKKTKIYGLIKTWAIILINIYNIFRQSNERKKYYEQIERIKKNKKIVLDLQFGGIGDSLVYTSLPRSLKEKYNIDFYLSKGSMKIFRNSDMYNLFFKQNPYFCGISEDKDVFYYKYFIADNLTENIFENKKQNVIEVLEQQFDLEHKGLPELYIKNKKVFDKPTMLVDLNWIFGKNHNLIVDKKIIAEEIKTGQNAGLNIVYVDPTKQNLEEYYNQIRSSDKFLCLISGGNALAATTNTNTTVVLPENLDGISLTNFLFKKNNITYKRNKPLRRYLG